MEYTPKKELAKQFLYLINQGLVDKAFANYVGSNFKHHLAECNDTIEDLKKFFLEQSVLNLHLQNIRLVEQSDLVMAHALIKRDKGDYEEVKVFVFRFDNQMIIEYWEVAQVVPHNKNNPNSIW